MKGLNYFIVLLASMFGMSCLDPYAPPENRDMKSYLVVDAFLNASENSCQVTLSRTVPLDGSEIEYETDAEVILESSDGSFVELADNGSGNYSIHGLTLDPGKTYKIKITTDQGDEYESAYTPIHQTPAIDSVSWSERTAGMGLFVSTHDPNNATHYYRWKFTETWMYNSAFESIYMEGNDTVIDRTAADRVYHCWRTVQSNTILVSSSTQLSQDIISMFQVHNIPWTSPRLSMRYSILVEQRAIGAEAFDYWLQLKKNTEDLGTIFDPMPSELYGNIRSTTDPNEIVLGFFSASTVEKSRIFFARNEISFPSGNQIETGYEGCRLSVVLFGERLNGYIPVILATESAGPFSVPIGYQVSSLDCVDCRRKGGTNVKPDFW